MTELAHATSWLHEVPTWLIILALMAAMMLAAGIGYGAGRRRHAGTADSGRGHFNAVQASLLWLLALLLSFTINMANQRYEARRQLVVEDANNLAALHLWSEYLPEPRRAEFGRLLREYVGTRADAQVMKWVTRRNLTVQARKARELHHQMCELIRADLQAEHPPKGGEAMVTLLVEAQGIFRKRVYAFQSRVPDSIEALLLVL